jgi:hypothetical protein
MSGDDTDDSECRPQVIGGGHRPNLGPIDLTNKPDSNLERLKQLKPLQRAGGKSTCAGAAENNKSLSEAVLKRRRLAANARERKVHARALQGLLTVSLLGGRGEFLEKKNQYR